MAVLATLPTPRRLPKPPEKPYKAPMTAVANLRWGNGIVLCADRQITQPGGHKYYEQKISIERIQNQDIVFAYSGLPSLALEAREKIVKKLTQIHFSEEHLYEICDDVFTNMGRQYTDMNLQMFISNPSVFEDPRSLRFDGKGLHRSENVSFLGVGDSSLLRYLVDMLYIPDMGPNDAINLAIYLVRKAEDYVDGCGGPIDLGIMDCGDDSCRMLSQDEIDTRLKRMEKQEGLLRDLILKSPFSSLPT
jgi:20S proteasome alpha/beta subunit